jgi:hypothetical protein
LSLTTKLSEPVTSVACAVKEAEMENIPSEPDEITMFVPALILKEPLYELISVTLAGKDPVTAPIHY